MRTMEYTRSCFGIAAFAIILFFRSVYFTDILIMGEWFRSTQKMYALCPLPNMRGDNLHI